MNEEELPLCECCCGERVAKVGNQFIHNHHLRSKKHSPETLILMSKTKLQYCTNPTSAIVCMNENESPTGSAINVCICEDHFRKGVHEGKLNEEFML